jgi:hypothetical protein
VRLPPGKQGSSLPCFPGSQERARDAY